MSGLTAGILADPHYSTAERVGMRFPRRSLKKASEAARAFKEAGAGIIICLGDIINDDGSRNEENLSAISGVLTGAGTKCVLVQGNHDRELFTNDTLSYVTGMHVAPFCTVYGGVRIITLDANYNSDGSPYRLRDTDWTDAYIPSAQIDFLRSSLAAGGENTYIFVHQCLDPGAEKRHIIKNAEEVRGIIRDSGVVKGVYQGHYHPGLESVVDGIPYHTLPAMCENGTWSVVSL